MFGADDPPTLCFWFAVHEGPINTMNYSQFTKKSNPFPKYIILMFSIMDVNHVHIDAYMYCNVSLFEILNWLSKVEFFHNFVIVKYVHTSTTFSVLPFTAGITLKCVLSWIYFSGAICIVVCTHCENDNEWKQTPCSFIVYEPKIKEIYSFL